MLKLIRSEKFQKNIYQATFLIAILGLFSRLIGFFRELLLASSFGAGANLDMYYTAFRIPDLIYNIFILGTLSVAFIPIYAKLRDDNPQAAERLTNNVLHAAVFAMALACIIVFIFCERITRFIAPGFGPEQLATTVKLTRVMLLSPILFTASSVFGSYLTALQRYIAIGFAPIFYNLGIIFGIIVLEPQFGLPGLAYGVIIGALLHLVIQAVAAYRLGYRWKPYLNLKDSYLRSLGIIFIPRLLSLDISFVSLIISSIFGSFLSAGSISVFNLAFALQSVSVGVFAVSAATASFSQLSTLHNQNKQEEFIVMLRSVLCQVLFFVVPLTLALLLYRAHIVRLAYGYGKFNWEDTINTFRVLGIMAFGVISQSLIPVLSRAFYARHNSITPMISGLTALVVNVFVSYFSTPRYGVIGLAFGFVAASITHSLILFLVLRSEFSRSSHHVLHLDQFDEQLIASVSKYLFASAIAGAIGYMVLYVIAALLNTRTVAGIFIQVLVSASLAGIVYLYTVRWFGAPEAERITQLLTQLKQRILLIRQKKSF